LRSFTITVDGQTYSVEIDDPNASPVQVKVNGNPFEVTIEERGEPQAKASEAPRAEVDLKVDAYVPAVATTFVDVDLEPGTEADAAGSAAAAPAAEDTEPVTAPMPGTVLDIAVKAGDQVAQGDTLCNLEAMKMKSPIRAPSAGTIAQILISEGQNVGYGDVLFTLG
jgi:biotin carboxyl carrier protein